MNKYAWIWLGILLSIVNMTKAETKPTKQPKNDLRMFVGTYTAKSNSKGIYLFHFNQETGVSREMTSARVENPSFLCRSKDGKFVYSVSEFSGPDASANVTPFDAQNERFGTTTAEAASPTHKGAEDPCNIWANGQFVVTSNYTGGSLSTYAIEDGGAKLKLRQFIPFQKLSENSVSHIHCARPTPDGKFMFVTDLGNDCIYRFTINAKASTENDLPFLTDRRIVYNGPSGWGPRHFIFSEDGQTMYLINELGGMIVVFHYKNGYLLPQQNVLAEEVPAHGSADIHLSPDGHYLYASHRLKNDGISIYKVDKANGMIRKVGYQRTAEHPRNFAITPNGKYVLVACRDGNCIEVYHRNKQTGLLENTHHIISLPKPVCIVFD